MIAGALLLAAAITVEGHVTAADLPLPGAAITITDSAGNARVVVSDVRGTYRVESVEPPYRVTAELSGFAVDSVRGNDVVMRVVNTPITVSWRPMTWSVAVAGSVTLGGRPLPGAKVVVKDGHRVKHVATTDDAGRDVAMEVIGSIFFPNYGPPPAAPHYTYVLPCGGSLPLPRW